MEKAVFQNCGYYNTGEFQTKVGQLFSLGWCEEWAEEADDISYNPIILLFLHPCPW